MTASRTNGKLVVALEASGLLRKGCGIPSLEALLTPRECEIVRLICQGLSNKQIAATADLAYSTVKNHITSIMSKLGLDHRTQIAVLALALAAGECSCRIKPQGSTSAQYLFPIDCEPAEQYRVNAPLVSTKVDTWP